ncbi:hypothetical protein TRFO_03864 [Tritrichomonas foetus]|uniref:Initiator binding domain-containing protein n=1 Tax=Tritrichomonas foetus TaxID=1144522 RepID=A0A1J4KL38_9EUKA|nr:hypothetical protein TRFO_03864 [Tritrichomonas foetus]|eukprot:OHT11656.1 hypothetical protein TRFO_03864 [Tritrichomonas foetus]
MSSTLSPSGGIPAHWEFLNDDDKAEYIAITTRFHEEIAKSKRGERIEVFVNRLKTIRDYINRDVNDQWKRILVCGIMFLNNALGINIQQLRLMMGKCKSSINGSLQQLGYMAKPSTHEIDQEITKKVPLLKDDHFELKKWTIRYGAFPEEKEKIRIEKHIPNKNNSRNANKNVNQNVMNSFNNNLIESIQTQNINILNPHQNMLQTQILIQNQAPQQIFNVKPIQLPAMEPIASQPSSPISAQEVIRAVNNHFPCPAKCRHKFYDLIHCSISIQTEA